MKIFDDIRSQPQETRETMFYLSVFITVLLVGIVWFNSFRSNLYVLMNPEADAEKALASENISMPSMFGYILQTAGEIKSTAFGLLGKEDISSNNSDLNSVKTETGKVYTLPLSEYK